MKAIKSNKIKFSPRLKLILITLTLFLICLIIYKIVYPQPRNWYAHYYFLAQSFLVGKVSVNHLPSFYQDKIQLNGQTYLPFPPAPGVLLALAIKIIPQITQQQVSVMLGAINVGLVFFLIQRFTKKTDALILSLFFGFGTVSFWSAVVGTTWYFAHIVALFFLLLSLLSHFSKKDFFSGIFFALAVLSRNPILLVGIFFFLQLKSQKQRLMKFCLGAFPLVPVVLLYNWARFGNVFQTGYYQVYKDYLNSNYPYTILKKYFPNLPLFEHLDLRNIPLHLFTAFLMPPIVMFNPFSVLPSAYGMGVVFTSPLLLLALKPPFKKGLEVNLLLGSLAVALIDFSHYMQGWVQFGYRFLLDFLPFLIIILALRFKLKKLTLLLVISSIIVNTWGTLMAIKLGW